MSLNSTPNGERVHIGIFGKRNAGKSSIINRITGQNIAIVSDKAGTTTDPVSKAMEILPLGPVLIIDTPGYDDSGKLGELRVEKSKESLRKTDLAIIVIGADIGISEEDIFFIKDIINRNLPYIICINKIDLADIDTIKNEIFSKLASKDVCIMGVSARNNEGFNELREAIASYNKEVDEKHVISDLLEENDTIVLVVPIDEAAPKGRLILPQQQVIRDALEKGVSVVVTREIELEKTLNKLVEPPKAVITDSQAFNYVSKIVPEDVYLTSFSILMARYKGDLDWQIEGAKAIERLENGSKVLISEGCTHHRQCGDIGTVKLPRWIKEYTNKEIHFDFTSGTEFPEDLSKYDLIVHCGGCTLNEKEMKYRIQKARECGVSITNYGVLISYINGILERSVRLLTIHSN